MTFPGGGAPGGYPGQGPQQPQQGPGYGPPAVGGGLKLGIPAIAYLVVAGLGVLNFFLGFAKVFDTGGVGDAGNYFDNGSLVPGVLLIGGLFALTVILPGDRKPGITPAVFSVAGALTVLFFTFSTEADIGIGTTLLIVFGLLQMIAAIVAYLFDAGILKPPVPGQQAPYGQPGGYGPQSGQFPAPGPQPGQFGGPAQPTQHYPQQPGQFGQPGQPGQPGQQPGTPPGGYPQQG